MNDKVNKSWQGSAYSAESIQMDASPWKLPSQHQRLGKARFPTAQHRGKARPLHARFTWANSARDVQFNLNNTNGSQVPWLTQHFITGYRTHGVVKFQQPVSTPGRKSRVYLWEASTHICASVLNRLTEKQILELEGQGMFRGALWFNWLAPSLCILSPFIHLWGKQGIHVFFFPPPSLLTARAICPSETVFGCTVLNPGDNQNEEVIVS